MTTFSIGQALGDAFGLMRRRPVAVFVWGSLFVVPSFGVLILLLPEFAGFMEASAKMALAPGDPLPPEAMVRISRLQIWGLGANLAQGVILAVAYTAVMRAILRPQERAGFSLRLGMDELRVGVIGVAILVGVYILMIIATVLGVIIAVAIWFGARIAFAPIIFFLVLAMLGFVVFAMARVSLIAPASVLRRDFAFDEGWDLGKGQALRLFGLLVSVFGLLLVIEFCLLVVGLIVIGGAVGLSQTDLSAIPDNPLPMVQTWAATHWPVVGAALVFASAFYGFVAVLAVAPFASACRQMARTEPVRH